MSFLTEYFDEYKQHPINKRGPCLPEERWAKMEGIWLDPKKGSENKEMSEEEIKAFIKKTMRSLRGQSTYFNEYCAHLDQEFKTRPFKPRVKKPCRVDVKSDNATGDIDKDKLEQERIAALPKKLALKDTVVMKMAKELFEKDLSEPTLEPLRTTFRSYLRVRPSTKLPHGVKRVPGYHISRGV
ncbi:uncharacterized protein LOC113236317 isoform X2 [Hyposmocoma kahamanoa]|uniref:uncharacterized protein LOC113236317 isoform X2 n=1 Tax=Hyposmocoma kahamanoa TaxID=1477025 RepID=UPI000E6D6C6F|nr:uncharacterized protein LOC113236317 isoform X2 [Hyposmocoma kahamanoa]